MVLNDSFEFVEAILNNSEHVMLYFFNECKDIQYLTASGVANRNYFHAAVSLPAKSMDTVVSKLVLNNCPVNWNDDTFQTPLLIGVEKHNIPFVRKILTLGGNVAMCNKDLDTPLHICVDKGSVEVSVAIVAIVTIGNKFLAFVLLH
jgi:ankyrin repeat protein